MPGTSDSIHKLFRNTRRNRGMTQSSLAAEAGCTQSAVSMFEAGRSEALSQEKIRAIADILELDISQFSAAPPPVSGDTCLKFCPIDECPANIPYAVRGELCFKPRLTRAATGRPTRCGDCGEVLEERCPNPDCSASVCPASFCPNCGTAYVSEAIPRPRPDAWADAQRARIRELRALSGAAPESHTEPRSQ